MTTVTTMRGKRIDITQILASYQHTIAIGNLSMNARGDRLGPGGKVIKRSEQIVADYYQSNPKAVKQVSLRNISPDVFDTPADATADPETQKQMQQTRQVVEKRARKLTDSE